MFAFVVTAAQTGTALPAYGIDFVNKNDTRRVFLRLLEHVAHTACTDADEHFDEIRTGNTEKRHTCLTCNRFCQQSFTRTRAACQQNTARHTAAQTLITVRRFQIINDFLYFFFRFVATGNIGKSNFVGIFIQQAGAAFAERECTALASAAALHTHKIEPRANQQQYGQQAVKQAGQHTRFFFRRYFHADFVVQQCFNQVVIQRRIGKKRTLIGALALNQIAADNRPFDVDAGYFATVYLLDKLRILDLLAIFTLLADCIERSHQSYAQGQPDQQMFNGIPH